MLLQQNIIQMLLQFPSVLGEAGATSSFDIVDFGIIDGSPAIAIT